MEPVRIDNEDNIFINPPKLCDECGKERSPKSVSGLCDDCEGGF